MSRRKEPAIPSDLLDQLLAGGDAAAALQQGGLLDSLKKALAERALNAEMDHHLGREEQAPRHAAPDPLTLRLPRASARPMPPRFHRSGLWFLAATGQRRLDIRPAPSATCPSESVLPIRLPPDFSVVFGGYAGGVIHGLAQKSPGSALSRAEVSAPVDTTRQGSVRATHSNPMA